VIALYNRIRRGETGDLPSRTVIFGGKAAPGYFMAKLIIKLIHSVAETIHADPKTAGLLRVVFLPNFNVKTAHRVYPAADLSEQISTAGKEASGTGNMKFSMNGALTIGTLDGANVEIREEVGAENFFLFGLTAAEVEQKWREGWRPGEAIAANDGLREAIELLEGGFFSRGDRDLFLPLTRALRERDDRRPGPSRRNLAQSGGVAEDERPQRRAGGKFFLGPGDPGILRKDLAGQTGRDRLTPAAFQSICLILTAS
jgi:starch phosphorylase